MAGKSNLVTAAWLAEHLSDPSVIVADCRFDLAQPGAGVLHYRRGHIPGAVYLDLESDLSGPKQAHGGRHPLPDIQAFSQKMGALGIDAGVTVVAYDAQQGSNAARLWWMLRYLGHGWVKVLDGGWTAWVGGGHPVTAALPVPTPRAFAPRARPELLVELEELRRRRREGVRLIDSRAPERYRGEVEPLDPVAGHIPGAGNLPWTENVDERGKLKPVPALAERLGGLRGDEKPPVVYCGSGVTACVNLLAMEEAGIRGAVLYLGGWSDWCSYAENPVARGA